MRDIGSHAPRLKAMGRAEIKKIEEDAYSDDDDLDTDGA